MRNSIVLFLVFASRVCFANMASPYGEGTKVSSVFSSRNINILNERIWVTVDQKFKTAAYVVEYNISTDTDGRQIPLLFYAVNYHNGFKVLVDGKAVELQNIPESYTNVSNSPFQNFANSIGPLSAIGQPQQVTIYWHENWGNVYLLSDLKYFEATLKKGKHQVRVEYTAIASVYAGGWIKQYSFDYSLSPARNWRSFGTLQINLNAQNFKGDLITNLGDPDSVSGKTQTWNFDKLPADFFTISYTPKTSDFTTLMLVIGPFSIALAFTLFLVILHLIFIIKSRRANPLKKYSAVTIAGSLFIPFLFFVIYLFSFDMIDNLIGDDASRRHGYIFLVIFLYPFVMFPYWLIMWLVDRYIKKKALSQK